MNGSWSSKECKHRTKTNSQYFVDSLNNINVTKNSFDRPFTKSKMKFPVWNTTSIKDSSEYKNFWLTSKLVEWRWRTWKMKKDNSKRLSASWKGKSNLIHSEAAKRPVKREFRIIRWIQLCPWKHLLFDDFSHNLNFIVTFYMEGYSFDEEADILCFRHARSEFNTG